MRGGAGGRDRIHSNKRQGGGGGETDEIRRTTQVRDRRNPEVVEGVFVCWLQAARAAT